MEADKSNGLLPEKLEEYKRSFIEGFGLRTMEDDSMIQWRLSKDTSLKEEYIDSINNATLQQNQQHLHQQLQHLQRPQVRKTMSWSVTSNPKERDYYLSPYACEDICKFNHAMARKRSVTLPLRAARGLLRTGDLASIGTGELASIGTGDLSTADAGKSG